jgi:hypothetical protein
MLDTLALANYNHFGLVKANYGLAKILNIAENFKITSIKINRIISER